MADSPEELRKKALETASVVEDALRSIADNIATAFEAAVSGTDRVSQAVAKDIQARFNKLAKVTDDVSSNAFRLQQGLLNIKKVQEQINERKIKEQSLGTQLVTYLKKQGNAVGTINDLIQKNINGNLELTSLAQGLDSEYQNLIKDYALTLEYGEDYINQLEEQKKKQEEINEKLGNTGKLVKGISKIPLLGNLIDTDKTLAAMNKNIAEGGNQTSAMKAGFKDIGGQLKTSLADPLTISVFLIKQFWDALKGSDKATGDLAKDFNITYNEASNVRDELIQIGDLSGNIALNARALQESMVAVGKALGSNAMLNTEDLKTFTELREMAGYTNEELVGIQKLTLATGGNLKNNTKQFLGTVSALNAQNKLTINEKQLLKEVANTSAAIKLSVGGTTEGLAKAAYQAKQFGINLDQADRIAESLLDFESSITNELSAELITGKDLNLEKARLLALNGDIAGASAEILQQVKGSAEFTNMNRIQQEALAKAVGMSREDLAASLVEREALAKIGEGETKAIDAYNRLKKEGLSDEQIAARLGDEQLATQLKQQSVQERLSNSIEKMKELFVGIAQSLMPVFDTFAGILDIVGLIFKPLGAIMNWAGSISPALKTIVGLLTAAGAAALFLSGSLTLGIGVAAILAAVGGGMAFLESKTKTKFANGGIVTGEINNATVGEAGPEAIIPLNSPTADKMLGITTPTNATNVPASQQNNSALMNKLDTLISAINNSNNKPIEATFIVDGEILTKAVGKRSSTLSTSVSTTAVKIQ